MWETKRKSNREKLKQTGGDHRLAQVLVKPEVFSIHMKGQKIRAQEEIWLLLQTNRFLARTLYNMSLTVSISAWLLLQEIRCVGRKVQRNSWLSVGGGGGGGVRRKAFPRPIDNDFFLSCTNAITLPSSLTGSREIMRNWLQ